METSVLPLDPRILSTCAVINVRDPRDMASGLRVSQRMPMESGVFSYLLQDRELLRARFRAPITTLTFRHLGDMAMSYMGDRFATRFSIDGGGVARYCFSTMFHGRTTLIQNGRETTSAGTNGLIYRGSPGTRVLTSDANARENLWIEAAALERALEGMLGERMREPLEFRPGIDWTSGLAASLRGQIAFITRDMARPDGVAGNPVALASLTDLIITLVLRGIPHNYQERLEYGRTGAVPAYVRRAEDFMRANAALPIRMEQVANAAGCGLRTLGVVFRQYRDTTPLAALHAIRLDQARAELERGTNGGSIAEVARRYGFTNSSRFNAAWRRRFRLSPADAARHAVR